MTTKHPLVQEIRSWDCCKTPRSRHSSQHYRRLLSVNEFNVGETKRRNKYFATVPSCKPARFPMLRRFYYWTMGQFNYLPRILDLQHKESIKKDRPLANNGYLQKMSHQQWWTAFTMDIPMGKLNGI